MVLVIELQSLWTNVFSEIYLKVLSIDGATRILDGIKDEFHIYEDSASRILDGIKDEVHIYEDIFALCFGIK